MVLMRFDIAPVLPPVPVVPVVDDSKGNANANANGNGNPRGKGNANANAKGEGQGEGEGKWVFPSVGGNRLVSSIHPPSEDVRVRVWKREKGDDDEWVFGFAEGV